MQDVFQRFLIVSDPYISNCRKFPGKQLKSLSGDAVNLLSASPASEAEINVGVNDSNDDNFLCNYALYYFPYLFCIKLFSSNKEKLHEKSS